MREKPYLDNQPKALPTTFNEIQCLLVIRLTILQYLVISFLSQHLTHRRQSINSVIHECTVNMKFLKTFLSLGIGFNLE